MNLFLLDESPFAEHAHTHTHSPYVKSSGNLRTVSLFPLRLLSQQPRPRHGITKWSWDRRVICADATQTHTARWRFRTLMWPTSACTDVLFSLLHSGTSKGRMGGLYTNGYVLLNWNQHTGWVKKCKVQEHQMKAQTQWAALCQKHEGASEKTCCSDAVEKC